jgi:peptidoglycan/xylan/chitin deacetylase (PgdA/CDA1 family)
LKKLAFEFFYWTGIVRLAAWFHRRRVVALCYHGVTHRPTRHPDDRFGLHVRADRFRRQLEYLGRHYQVIAFRDYLRAREGKMRLPNYSVLVTFDDGHRNFYTSAAPLLQDFSMPALMFLISNRVVGDELRPKQWTETDDQNYLSWHEVKELGAQGFEFGSHTCSHHKLPQLSAAEVEHELRDSRTAIQEHLATETLPLAYPYGMANDAIAARTADVGYVCAFTSATGFNDAKTDTFRLHRTLIGDDDDTAAFAARLAGLTR